MAILALEPDRAHASAIRHIVVDIIRADLKIVRSMEELLLALGSDIPDVILLPALLSPADETRLLAHVSTLRDSGYLEMLVTPFAFGPEDSPVDPQVRRPWRWKQSRPRPRARACDPRAFAERLAWSLQKVKEEHLIRSEERMPSTCLVPTSCSERRADQRFSAAQLQGLRAARISNGPLVKLVDCSAGGALVESETPLPAESEAVLELTGGGTRTVIPFRVVRSHATVVESRLIYRGACAFSEPLEVADLLLARAEAPATPTSRRSDRFDRIIKEVVEGYTSHADSDADTLRSLRAVQMTELQTSLRELSGSRPWSVVGLAIGELLAVVDQAAQESGEHADVFGLIEERLRVLLPGLTARFAAAPALLTTARSESLYLALPSVGGADAGVLNVELPQGVALEDWQFRLLKASTYVAALLRPVAAAEESRRAEGRDRRQYRRLPGRFDGRRVGAISLPVVIHDISEAGCLVDSFHDEEKSRALTLEIHLPDRGWITVRGTIVENRPGAGFAVRFVELCSEIRAHLVRVMAA